MFNLLSLSIVFIVVSTFSSPLVHAADEFEDYRCRCVCPSFTVLQDPSMNESDRRVYVDVVPPENCTCERVVFHSIPASSSFQQRFCPRYKFSFVRTSTVVVFLSQMRLQLRSTKYDHDESKNET